MILVIAEQSGGKLNRTSWETIVGAQQLAGMIGGEIAVLVAGANVSAFAAELAAAQVKEVAQEVVGAPRSLAVIGPFADHDFSDALQR